MIHDGENLLHVGRLADGVGAVAFVVGVGCAENRPLAPWDREQDPLALRHHDRFGDVQSLLADDNVNPFAQPKFDVGRGELIAPRAKLCPMCGEDILPA